MTVNAMEAVEATPAARSAFEAVTKAMRHPLDKPLTVVGIHDFIGMQLPPRDTMLSPWLMTQSLSMIYGWRGTGKTHVSLGVSYAVAGGGEFLHWKADKPRRVLLGKCRGPPYRNDSQQLSHLTEPNRSLVTFR